MSDAQRKSETIATVLATLHELHAVAEADASAIGDVDTNRRQGKLGAEIRKIVEQVRDPEAVGLLARVAYGINYPERAETIRYDEVFAIAYRQCVERLLESRQPQAQNALAMIKGQMRLNPHESELLEPR